MTRIVTVLTVVLVTLALAACQSPQAPPYERDFDAIIERDTLVALLASNSTSYFVYRGEPMGFEYELLRAFAREHDLVLRVRVTTPDSLFPLLHEGVGDVAAARLKPDTLSTPEVRFTRALYASRPTLVQGRTDGPALPEPVEDIIEEGAERHEERGQIDAPLGDELAELSEPVTIRARAIRSPRELAGETVHVTERSPHTSRLIELSDSLSGDIHVVEVDDAMPEDLIQRVAYGDLDLTVTSEALANLQADRFDNVVAVPTLGAPEDVAWAVRANAPRLRTELDAWISDPGTEGTIRQLYQRYYHDRRGYRSRAESEYLTSVTGALSPYDHLFQQYADSLGWDWRLLASQAYQESRFVPTARSWAGAAGLLQLMPATGREFGVRNAYDPADNVAAAVRFIRWLENYWVNHIDDEEERLRFVLASYNTGHGHVEDARRLAAKDGLDDTRWSDVAFWLLQKSNPQVYRDPVVRFGFSRGLEPVHYVEVILDRFDHYRQFQREGAPNTAPPPPDTPPLATIGGVR